MNKRVFFVLLPLIAILFSLNCMGDSAILLKRGARESVLTSSRVQIVLPNSVKLNKENNKETKNKIRVKAWDDNSDIDISVPWCQSSEICHSDKPVYAVCVVYVQSTHFFRNNLRGPPANNI